MINNSPPSDRVLLQMYCWKDMSVAMEHNIGVFDPGKRTGGESVDKISERCGRNWPVIVFVSRLALAGLLESLVGSRDAISASKEELDFLSNLLQSKELHALFKVYNTIVDRVRDDRRCSPVLSSSMQTTLDVMEVILPRIALSDTSRQLFQLLQNPHIQVCIENLQNCYLNNDMMVDSLGTSVCSWRSSSKRLPTPTARHSSRDGWGWRDNQDCAIG